MISLCDSFPLTFCAMPGTDNDVNLTLEQAIAAAQQTAYCQRWEQPRKGVLEDKDAENGECSPDACATCRGCQT